MQKNKLDEMQLQKRNKIGHQAFMMLSYLIMLDVGLYGFGFRWLQYPMNVFIIMLACMSYYLIRVIWNNAYIGPETSNKPAGKRTVFTVVMAAVLAAAVAAVAVFMSHKNIVKTPTAETGDNGAMILFVFSSVSLIIAAIVGIISKRQNRDNGE